MKMAAQGLQDPLETGVPLEPWDCRAPKALTAIRERQANKDRQEWQVKGVLLVKMEKLARLVHQVHRAWQEKEGSRVHPVSMDSRVCLETKDPLVNLENQVTWVFLES